VSYPSAVWGGAPAKIEFGALYLYKKIWANAHETRESQ